MRPPIGGPIEAPHRRLLCIECPQPGVDPGHLQRPLHVRRNTQQTEVPALLPEQALTSQEVVTLSPGDTLITFSDGVSEAMDAEGTEFGDERILECLPASPKDIAPRELLEQVMAGVRQFTVGEPQSDDITGLGELVMLDRRQ